MQLLTRLGKEKKAAGVNSSDLHNLVVAHTGQSSQLVSDATGRIAQFLATIGVIITDA